MSTAYVVLAILIMIACVLLVLVVLIQNPKGGGLSSTFGGGGNQIMGAKRTTDFLEKTTWTLAITLIGLSLLGSMLIGPPQENQAELKASDQIREATINSNYDNLMREEDAN